jgi:hypothetical protein
VWWAETPSPYNPVDAKLVMNTSTGAPNVLLTEAGSGDPTLGYTAEQLGLNGSVVDSSIRPSSSYQPNAHEVQLLTDGNYLVAGSYSKSGYNLSSYGGPANASIRDDVLQEVTPSGAVVWTWDAAQDVGLSQVNSQWWPTIIGGGSPYDVFHLNSAVTDASGNVLVSLRYTDAIFYVNNPGTSSGNVIWKLGGSQVAESLTVKNDPVFSSGGGFGGQHYARFFSNGDGNIYVTLHDNGTGQGRAPRGVEYEINPSTMTATLVQQVTDGSDPGLRSSCCGSAQLLPGGDWVVSWGGDPIVAELTPSGTRVFAITFSGVFSYRAFPILPGVLNISDLRADMDGQYALPG